MPFLDYNARVQAKTFKKLAYKTGNLLYHSSHGPCRVKEVIKQMQGGKEQFYYSLESKQTRFKGARFLIDIHQVETSGFHPAISAKEANKIMEFLRCGELDELATGAEQPKVVLSLIEQNNSWAFARVLLIYALEKDGKAAKGKREMLTRAVRGLVNELSYSLEIPEEDAVMKMKKNLRCRKVNSWTLETLSSVLV